MTGHKTETLKEGYSTYYLKDKANLALFYGRYDNKKRVCKTCLPYVPIDENTDNDLSLTYDDWKSIIQIYFKYLCLYMLTGKRYRFSSHIGEFQIQKYKSRKKNLNIDFASIIRHYMKETGIDDWEEAKKYVKNNIDNPKLFRHRNKHTMGFKWRVIWFKKEYRLAFKHHWTFLLSKKGAWTYVNNLFKEDRKLIHNILESKYSLKKHFR